MSINPNLQQINVFNKGMNTDTSDAYMPSDLYRFARNVRFITNLDGNSGEIRCVEGLNIEFRITGISSVIKALSVRDTIVCICRNSDRSWSIYKKEKSRSAEKIFGPCYDDLGEDISMVARWESDNNVKVYVADGLNRLFSVYIDDEHKSLNGSSLSNLTGSVSFPLPQLSVEIQQDPTSLLKAHVLLYAYVLYKEGGNQTNLSPMSKPVVLSKIAGGGYREGLVASQRVDLLLESISTTDSYKMKIYRIEYIKNGLLPDVYLIYDGDIISETYEDRGAYILEVSNSEFVSLTNAPIKPLLIESKNDYLYAANIQYEQQEVDSLFKDCSVTYEPVLRDFVDRPSFVFRTTSAVRPDPSDDNPDTIIKYNENKNNTFKRGETYRFGVVFYDKSGRKSSVMCIRDVPIPDTGRGPSTFEIDNRGYVVGNTYSVKAIITFSDSAKDNCSGYEIVRCKRTVTDTKNLLQGIIGRTQQLDDQLTNSSKRLALSHITMDDYVHDSLDRNGTNFKSSNDVMMFACPEYAYQSDDVQQELKDIKDNLQIQFISRYSTPSIKNTRVGYIGRESYIYANDNGVVLGDGTSHYNGAWTEYGLGLIPVDNDDKWHITQNGYVKPQSESANIYRNSTSTHCLEFDSEENVIRQASMSVMYCIQKLSDLFTGSYNIKNIGYAKSPEYNMFNSGESIIINDTSISVGNLQFVNWDAIDFYARFGYFGQNGVPITSDMKGDTMWNMWGVTPGGKCMVLEADIQSADVSGREQNPFSITIANIVNTHANPYGGDTEQAKLNSVFYSFGDYLKYNGQSSEIIYTDNGDAYISLFEYNSAHCWDSDVYRSSMFPTVYLVPIESDINLRYAYGDLFTKMDNPHKFYFQDTPAAIREFTQENHAYLYDTAYNSLYDVIPFMPIKYTSISNDRFDCRVTYSDLKTNGEMTDSWLNFRPANFMDVDTRYGLITELKLFKDQLVFWQENATGLLSSNDKTVLLDTNSTNIVLGNGDILLRYDYLTTIYGMRKGDHCSAQSDTALYWWDSIRKDMIQYPGGNHVLPLKKVKTVSNYINSIRETDFARYPELVYDPKYSEILAKIERSEYLVYNEYILQFTSVYDVPTGRTDYETPLNVNGSVYFYDNDGFYKWNFTEPIEDGQHVYHMLPSLQYVVNKDSTLTKVYDNVQLGMGDTFYYGSLYGNEINETPAQTNIKFTFTTPLKQSSTLLKNITDREYDIRFAIPRDGGNAVYGNRLRGRTMQCKIDGTDYSFSLLYIITKYRISNS